MEQRIKSYEQFITKASRRPSEALARYHREMLANFQHERLVHLIVTLFFALLALAGVVASFVATLFCPAPVVLVPLYIVTGILVVLTGVYTKHYYFLENHIQALYDYSRKLAVEG